jgi:hypothetical protein
LDGRGLWYTDDTDPPTTTIEWTVTPISAISWHYDYTLSIVANGGEISHLIIEASDGFGTLEGDIFNASGPYTAIEIGVHNGGEMPNLNMPDDMYGIKFDETTGYTVHVQFDSYRGPVWGDFYAVDGNRGGTLNEVWNVGFTSPDTDPDVPLCDGSVDYHIIVPDTYYGNGDDSPELGTWLLLACTAMCGAALRRRKK